MKSHKRKANPPPQSERLPLDDVSEDPQAIEDSLEREATSEHRDRLSSEYGNAARQWATPEETRFQPDGREVYPEPESEFRARGGNIEGSLERQKREERDAEPAVEPPDVSAEERNAESDGQGAESEGNEE
jgi:hypothetical protein